MNEGAPHVVDGLLMEAGVEDDLGFFELPPRIPEEDVIARRGKCSGTRHDGFTDLSRGNSKNRHEALKMCARCPVQRECRIVADYIDSHAGEFDLLTGIWAGEGPAARERRRELEATEVAA